MNNLNQHFDNLKNSEKIILAALTMVVVYAAMEFLLLKPTDDQNKKLRGQLAAAQTSLQNKQDQLNQHLASGSANTNGGNQRTQLQAIDQQINRLQQQLATIASGLVSAENLPVILEDMLVKTGKLSLQKLRALPVEELQLSTTDGQGQPLSAGVFKHVVALQLEGRFFDVIEYLKTLEALPWGFRWQNLHYRAKDYPIAAATLEVYTLTTEEGLFGEI